MMCNGGTIIYLATTLLMVGVAHADGDARRGEQIYQSCQDCHSLDENDVGPKHRGVFGRVAGSVPDYNYSLALKNSRITWNEKTLDQWLIGPKIFVPGTKMGFVLSDAKDRADVIEYLRTMAK
jgi:cytochrome c